MNLKVCIYHFIMYLSFQTLAYPFFNLPQDKLYFTHRKEDMKGCLCFSHQCSIIDESSLDKEEKLYLACMCLLLIPIWIWCSNNNGSDGA